jgi:hypothetical protein
VVTVLAVGFRCRLSAAMQSPAQRLVLLTVPAFRAAPNLLKSYPILELGRSLLPATHGRDWMWPSGVEDRCADRAERWSVAAGASLPVACGPFRPKGKGMRCVHL